MTSIVVDLFALPDRSRQMDGFRSPMSTSESSAIAHGIEIEAGWRRTSRDGVAYVSLSLAAPEFASSTPIWDAPQARTDDNVLAVIRNPAD